MQDVSLILIGEKINYLICQAPPPRLLFIRLFNSFSDLFLLKLAFSRLIFKKIGC